MGFDDLYGLADQRQKLERLVVNPVVADGTLETVQSICLSGRFGTRKDRLAEALVGELSAEGFSYYDPTLATDDDDEFKQHLAALLDDAREHEPSVLLFSDNGRTYERAGNTLREKLAEARDAGETVLAVTLLVDPEVHRGRRGLDRLQICPDVLVDIGDLSKERRKQLLRDRLSEQRKDGTVEFDSEALDFDALAEQLDWAFFGEIKLVCERIKHAFSHRESTVLTQTNIEDIIAEVQREREYLDSEQPGAGFDSEAPEAHEEKSRFAVEETGVTYDDVGGLDSVIERLTELLTVPSEYPGLFEDSNLQATRGVLLHGPPGNGKTLLARALATETERRFLSVRGPELKDMYFGETERKIRELFETADKNAPSIIFFDEFDAIAGDRSSCTSSATTSTVNMLLSEMDGLEERGDILFLAATNRIEALDEAVLRPGRIGATVEVTPPDAGGRAEIFELYCADLPTDDDVTPAWFVETAPDGLSGAEIEAVCRQATHAAVRDDGERPTVGREHVREGLHRM